MSDLSETEAARPISVRYESEEASRLIVQVRADLELIDGFSLYDVMSFDPEVSIDWHFSASTAARGIRNGAGPLADQLEAAQAEIERLRAEVGRLESSVGIVEFQRDAFFDVLTRERVEIDRLRAEVGRLDLVDSQLAVLHIKRDRLLREVGRMRPVVEAAERLHAAYHSPIPSRADFNRALNFAQDDAVDSVDSYHFALAELGEDEVDGDDRLEAYVDMRTEGRSAVPAPASSSTDPTNEG